MKLPKFLFDYVVKHQTSLGNNLAFPPEEDYPFDYKILKNRLNEVDKATKEMFGDTIDSDKAQNLLSKYLVKCQKIEEPIKEQLIKICENTINKLFSIPKETVELNCQLVQKISPKNSFRVLPEEADKKDFVFADLNEMSDVNKVVLKRRFINALVQGASYRYSQLIDLYINEFTKLNLELPHLYKKIITLNDFLLFNKKEKISDKYPKQGAVVEVELGREGEKTVITAQGTNFIFLLTETIRGFFELFASHGLPKDNKKAMYIISQADFLLAEPWDLRMGVPLWDILFGNIEETKLIPYVFTQICEMLVDEFNEQLQEILAKTKKGKETMQEIIKQSEKEYEMMNIHNFIQDKNDNETLINDSYFTADELNDDENVIEEECFTANELSDENNDKDKKDNDYLNIICNSDINEMDFKEESLEALGQYQMHIFINDIEIPISIIDFKMEPRMVNDNVLYQVHLFINSDLQHKGIGTKILLRAVQLYGNVYSGFGRMLNRTAVLSMFRKLKDEYNINVTYVNNAIGKKIGIIAKI